MEEGTLEKIFIKGLNLRTIIGTNPEERIEKQDISIDITLWLNLKDAIEKDDLSLTLNYKKLKKKIIDMVERSSYHLIEALAYNIGKICLEEEKVMKVKVKVEKPGALRYAKVVGVEIELKR